MNLENYISVTGLQGLYKMAGNRKNGLIVEDLDSGKRKFCPARRHQFTPLESIAIYTDDGESIELKNVFRNMHDQFEDNPPPATSSKPEDLREYFFDVLPTHDEDRVYTSDIKKVIKWFVFLNERGLLEDAPEATEAEAVEEEQDAQ
ncbi:MAG: DUF5606 domain-containing protein [Bacteroidota bacterium]